MDEESFQEHRDKEGWSDDNDESMQDDPTSLSFSKFYIYRSYYQHINTIL